MKRVNKTAVWGGGAVTVAAATAVWTAMTALPGGAYSLKAPLGLNLPSANSAAAAPMASSAAVHEAVAMQTAFNQVANAAGPAVVTITTMENIPTPRNNFGGMPFRFGGRGGFGGGNGGQDPFNDFFRQFFGNQGGMGGGAEGGPGMEPNDFSDGQPASGGHEVRAGLGSGFIIRQDGLILTNAHVVRGASRVTVKVGDTTYKNAKVLGMDERTDVAVVKIPAQNLPTVILGDSDAVNVGDWSIAVGNPFGLDHTVTVGVISAKGKPDREVPGEQGGVTNYLQTDASINPGNSGGPLLDIYGHVVGINNSIYNTGSGGNVGIGFAVPINTAKQIAEVLVRDGRVRRAKLGIGITNVEEQASAFGLDPTTRGVLVQSVEPNSPAANAGIQPGDIITAINGKGVTRSSELQNTVAYTPIGQSVSLDILRGGKHQTITARVVELKEAPDANAANGGDNDNDSVGSAQPSGGLGVRVQPLTADFANQLGINPTLRGLVVTGVQNGSPAAEAGIQPGDVIERVGQTAVATRDQLKAAVSAIQAREAADSKSVALLINRRGSEQYIIVGDAQ